MMRSSIILFSITMFAAAAGAQQQPPAQRQPARPTSAAVGDTSIFAPLDLPAPNGIRDASGAPGARYWENHADYDLKATLDTSAKSVRGEMVLRYTNHSPDTLRFLWMQVEQNAFTNNSLNALIFPEESRFGARGFEGGDMIDRLEQIVPGRGRVALAKRVHDTMMKVDLAEPLAPGKTAT